MESTEFDKVIDRHNTGCIKWEWLPKLYGRSDVLPMWVADMEFATPSFVTEALRRRMDHPVFGYTQTPPEYWGVVSQWIEQHHHWKVSEEWMTFIPGIVKGIGFVINVFTRPDEKVIIQPPVYHPFRLTPQGNHRQVVLNPLREHPDGTYSMDFENLAEVADSKCRVLILSNPHNPAGILWDRITLERLASFCSERNIIVISDEIHCDMALWGKRHIPFASVSPEAEQCSITFGAPSKTFNIAGIVSSYAIVPNEAIRSKLFSWLEANELSDPTLFAPIATMAAFREGEQWRCDMLRYVEGNIQLVEDFCKEHNLPIRPIRPDASFLIWLNCRDLGMTQPELVDFFVNRARLALNDGEMFGYQGRGFMRMNVGAPRSMILEALNRLDKACKEIQK